MSGDGDDLLEILTSCHKEEKKELQARIQTLKKGIPKGDKKKNKEVKAQIAILENEQSVRHETELKELDEKMKTTNGLTSSPEVLKSEHPENIQDSAIQRVSKAQKKRDKKALKAKHQAEIVAEAEKDYVNTQRYAEEEKIRKLLADLNLKVKPMVSDGNCLYYAVADQLKSASHSSEELRKLTSTFMLSHADDFLPFLTNLETGDPYTHEEFEQYCKQVAETTAWGGQLELRAMSHVLQSPIHIIQADVPVVKVGEEYKSKPLILCFHHHELGLGEHYNSVQPLMN